jgi:hypothetical protein
MPNLDCLILDHCPVQDDGVANLKGLENLRILELRGTKVTLDGLLQVAPLPKLKYLRPPTSAIRSQADIEALKAAFPNVDEKWLVKNDWD